MPEVDLHKVNNHLTIINQQLCKADSQIRWKESYHHSQFNIRKLLLLMFSVYSMSQSIIIKIKIIHSLKMKLLRLVVNILKQNLMKNNQQLAREKL